MESERPVVRQKVLISRDEMNLAEFPLTVLSTRANPTVKTLEFQDSIRSKTGELIDRKWIITGADKFGLPTASDDEVILGLLKLTVDNGFTNRKVYFTRYELLKALRWTTEGRSYTRVQRALDRLSGVRIKATNGFFDNASKSHSTINFGIVDAYQINDGRDSGDPDEKTSFFTWSEVLFKSFQVGFIKKLDLDFYLGLRSAVTKRLYRYLDKHFWYKSRLQIPLFTLAHEKIGISRTYQYVSSIRQQIDPAIEELTTLGFLGGCEYIGRGKGCEIVLTAARSQPRSISQNQREPNQDAALADSSQSAERDLSLHDALVARGIREKQVEALLKDRTMEDLQRIEKIVAYYDKLLESRSKLVSISPVGFLYRAIQNSAGFVLPDEPKKPAAQQLSIQTSPRQKAGEDKELLQAEYLKERRREIIRCKGELEPAVLRQLTSEVENALVRLRSAISEQRFNEAVNLGVEDRIAKLFALPSFEEWIAAQPKRSIKQVVGG